MHIDVVIVTYNSSHYIHQCLDSVLDSGSDLELKVYVVDNASIDDSVELASSHTVCPEIMRNAENTGFAAACNKAIKQGKGEYILLLNPDAMLHAGTLKGMVAYLETRPEVGIVGPRLTGPDGDLQKDHSSTGIFPGFRQGLYEYTRLHRLFPQHYPVRAYFLPTEDRLKNLAVAMVQGACFLFRRQLYRELGELDQRYFLYFEETDFCKRAHDAGWQVHYLGEFSAQHVGGHSMRNGRQDAGEFIRSMYLFHWKHTGKTKTVVLWNVLFLNHFLRFIRLRLASRNNPGDTQLRLDLNTCTDRMRYHLSVFTQKRTKSENSRLSG